MFPPVSGRNGSSSRRTDFGLRASVRDCVRAIRPVLGAGALLLLAVIPAAAKTGDAGSGNYCMYGEGTTDWTGDHCTATATIATKSFVTDYHGKITVEFPFKGRDNYTGYLKDFYFSPDLWIDGGLQDTDFCNATCSGKLKYEFSSPNGAKTYTVKVVTAVSGETSCSDDSDNQTFYITRPPCPSHVSLSSLGTYNQWTSGVTIQGTVYDDGCGATVSGSSAVQITVVGPNDAQNSPWLAVSSSGTFSWTYSFPRPKLPRDYGTYTATAVFDGSKNSNHTLDDSEGEEGFQLEFLIVVPNLPSSGNVSLQALPFADPPQLGVTDPATSSIYFYDREGTEPTGVVSVNWPVPASGRPNDATFERTPLDLPLPESSMRGLAIVPDFVTAGPYPLLALTYEGSDVIRFFDTNGTYVAGYPTPLTSPWGLTYDGAGGLWCVDRSTGELRKHDLETGVPLESLVPGLIAPTDLAWDETNGTILVLSEAARIVRVDPSSGAILEDAPLRSPGHGAVLTNEGGVWVVDAERRMYLASETPGTPAHPGQFAVHSDEETPTSVELTWVDPDQAPPWDSVQVYRDGEIVAAVPPGEGRHLDEGLTLYDSHEYFLTVVRNEDGVESAPTESIPVYVGRRPPATWLVPGDFASIQTAIAAALDEDVIEVAPGTYAEPIRFLGRNVTVVSRDGPEVTILDASGCRLPFVVFDSTETRSAALIGFTISGADLAEESVVVIGPDASPMIEGNVFTNNQLFRSGAVVSIGGEEALVRAENGAYRPLSTPLVRGNTFAFNRCLRDADSPFQGGVVWIPTGSPTLESNIVAFNDNAVGIQGGTGTPTLSCNACWENELGSYSGLVPGSSDLAVDPLFCDPESGDLALCENSPLLDPTGCGRIGALGAGCGPCTSPLDHADHDVGNVRMTLTERGILGFLDGSQSVGSGFVYPASENNLLYIGGLWVGLEPEYVANRDYDADPAREWQVASDPDGHVWIHPYGSSDQDIHAAFDDAGAVQPRGLRVAQESWAFADPANDDYVILRYTVENTGTTDWSSVYAGVFLDLDLGDALDDVGGVDQIRDLVYLTDANGIHAGLRVLSGVREGDGTPGHEPIANITLVDNETYVWPLAYVPDGEKHAFLAASDPAHVLSVSPDPGDYSLLASLGPFELAPGEAREVAFAVVGGASLASLGTHADAAQIAYLHPVGLAEPSAAPTRARILFNSPNPFANGTSIGFSVPAPCPIRLQVFDSQGRCLRSLYDGPASPGLHVIVWDGRDQRGRVLAAGIYYVRLRAGAEEDSRGLLLIR